MAELRSYLINDPTLAQPQYKQLQLAVYNTNTGNVQNGGQCCCWVVPTGVSFATFELWGAGGDGGGACCCMGHYYGPFSGNYVKKTLQVTAGCYFCICAAGSGCCMTQCCGSCGFPSYVLCGSNGSVVSCAAGGCGGCVLCFRSYQGCTGICIPSCNMGCYYWGDMGFQSINSANHVSNYCWQIMKEWQTGASKFSNNTRMGLDHCVTSLTIMGCFAANGSTWPGGTGNSATACGGGCCWGSWGAGGLVLITYG